MSKSDRLSLIRKLAGNRKMQVVSLLPGLMHVSQGEVLAEFSRLTHSAQTSPAILSDSTSDDSADESISEALAARDLNLR